MFYHFELSICIAWKFNLLPRNKTCTMVTWLAGLYISTFPSLDTAEVLAAFQQPKFQAVSYEDFHNLCWSRSWAFSQVVIVS